MSFLILSHPRSRSFWLSKYLSYTPHVCGHDIILQSHSLADYIRNFTAISGSVELSLARAWQYIMNLFPEVKIVVVRRPIEQVYDSLQRVGVYLPIESLEIDDQALRACAFHPRVASIEFRDLSDPECGEWLFEHCLDMPWDAEWYRFMAEKNIQLEVHQRMAAVKNHVPILDKILLEAARVDPNLKGYYAS